MCVEKKQFYVLKSVSTNWIGYILRRNCFLKHVIEGKIEGRVNVMERWGRRRKQLLDDLQKTRRNWKSKEEEVDHSLWTRLWTFRQTDYIVIKVIHKIIQYYPSIY
jgi:hypothetical protein